MTKEMKQIFTRRVTQANRTQLVVVMYDILLTYLEDGMQTHAAGDVAAFRDNLKYARDCIAELRKSLDFQYDLSRNLFAIYAFADRELANDMHGNKTDHMSEIIRNFRKLRDAYDTISKQDKSEPLMTNAQDVYAGFTYGKTDINESLLNNGIARGYSV